MRSKKRQLRRQRPSSQAWRPWAPMSFPQSNAFTALAPLVTWW